MSKAGWSSVLVVCVLLGAAGVLSTSPARRLTATSFGTIPVGYGALFDLLAELGLPVARSYAMPADLPPTSTVWWIAPAGFCDDAVPVGTTPWGGRSWIEMGGTAVIFLGRPPDSPWACGSIAGTAVPARLRPDPRENDRQAGEVERVARRRWAPALDTEEQIVTGPAVSRERRLDVPALAVFAEAKAWTVPARLEGRPFVIEQSLGRGRLVLVADATSLQNAWLSSADAAPFVLDLVRAFGVPHIDERAHGLRAEDNAAAYLAKSPALPVFAGLALLGVLVAWRGAAWPPAPARESDTAAPVLETFVQALAGLYAQTRDHERVLQCYRHLTLARLRRHFGLPPDTAPALLLERLQLTRHLTEENLRVLTQPVAVTNRAALQALARRLDALAREATA